MKKLNFYKYASLSLLVLNVLLLAFLFFRPGPGHDPKRMIIHELDLSGDQVKEYEALIQDHRATVQALEKTLFDAKRSLYDQLEQTEDTAERDRLLDELSRLHRELEQAHFEHFSGLRAICTQDQLPQFRELLHKLPGLFVPRPGRPGASQGR